MNQTSLQEMELENRFEISLTHDQYKKLQKILPEGYSLSVSNKNTRLARKIAKSSLYDTNSRKRRRKSKNPENQNLQEGEINLKRSLKILNLLKTHPSADPFKKPVDPEALRIPQYYEIIKQPMDISTVEYNLRNEKYTKKEQFEKDVNLIWGNACQFNPADSQVFKMAVDMKNEFVKLNSAEYLDSYIRKKSLINRKNDNWARKSKLIEAKPLNFNEQRILSEKIKDLAPEDLWGVWNIVQTDKKERDEELEFNIATLPPKKARELQKYVNSKFVQTGIKKKPKPVVNKRSLPQPSYSLPTNSEPYNNPGQQIPIVSSLGNQNVPKQVNQDSSNSSFISDLDSDN